LLSSDHLRNLLYLLILAGMTKIELQSLQQLPFCFSGAGLFLSQILCNGTLQKTHF